ncbi:MAG: Na+/H+ antiporter NhaA [Deltaproteobacteria bacterium]|nr:Na+/H+ antiporter NhaA [Deltaproteobacteria bacterium]
MQVEERKESGGLETADHLFFYPWERQFERLITPFEEFIHRQTTSGIILMITTLIALILSNSPLSEVYGRIVHTPFSLSLGGLGFGKDLGHWINEGLMVFFFLLVGCEIKREILVGDLADIRAAVLPIVAATGGMLMPALIYHLLNPGGDTAHGWGIPMATDIAFCVGALVLLGKRVPAALTLFLVSLAIVDDLGAVLVIALFYTEQIHLLSLAMAGLALLVLMLLNLAGVRLLTPYGVAGLGLWMALLSSGVHATIAGVLLAFCLPARPRHDCLSFSVRMKGLVDDVRNSCRPGTNLLKDTEQYSLLKAMMEEVRLAEAPLQRVQNALHIPTSLLVIPFFALANAGIPVDPSAFTQLLSEEVTLGGVLGLVAGKFVGVAGFSWLALKTGLGRLPSGLRMAHLAGAGLLAGIGFTMSIFIAELSFPGNAAHLNIAKSGIIFGSLVSGLLGVAWLWLLSATGGAGKP